VPPPSPLTNQPTCKPGSVWRKAGALRVTAIPLERRLPGASSNLPGRRDSDTYLGTRRLAAMRPTPSLFGFAPGGVCPAACVAAGAVRSYRTISPLPLADAARGSAPRRFVFCGTVPGVAPAGRYPAPYVHGARTFLPGDLSVPAGAAVRSTDAESNGVRGARRQGAGTGRGTRRASVRDGFRCPPPILRVLRPESTGGAGRDAGGGLS
jgi:hypothetical protein